jgi:DNA-binding transcriptional ArsR family regulator
MEDRVVGEKRSSAQIDNGLAIATKHPMRADILSLLNEGTYTTRELAEIMGEPVNNVAYHVKALFSAGVIDLAKVVTVRNANEHYYRAVEMPYFSDEQIATMPPEERKQLYGLALQAIHAESLASFRAGKMHSEPRHWIAWRWLHLDSEGRNALADELAESWERCRKIEDDSLARCADSREDTRAMIVATLGFERHRPTNASRPYSTSKL